MTYAHPQLTLDPRVLEAGTIYKIHLRGEEYIVIKDHQGRLNFHEVLEYEVLKKVEAVTPD